MRHADSYDDDILLWSEQQANVIRRLGRNRRNLPNELDVEHVAEEIESVGRSELAAVESQLQNVLLHLMKIAGEPGADASRHWKTEIIAFHGEMRRRYTLSMRQRIDLRQLWRLARELMIVGAEFPDPMQTSLPESPPFELEELLLDKLDILSLAARISPRHP